MRRKFRIRKEQVLCIFISVAVFVAAECLGGGQALKNGSLVRGNVGTGETQYEVLVGGLEREAVPVEITVSSRSLGKEEAEQRRKQVMDGLPERIRGENVSLEEVRTDLDLISGIDESGITLNWETGDPELIDVFGKVYNEELSEEGMRTYLRVQILDETGESTFHIPVRILPPDLSESEEKLKAFSELVDQVDQETREEEHLTLPKEFLGAELTYRMKSDRSNLVILILGILLAGLYGMEGTIRQGEREKRRRSRLMLDYSEVVSKMQVYLGAGMTVRTAWERIGADYQREVASGRKKTAPAYEEILRTCTEMGSGVPETEAYRRFGRRCGLRPYLKLSSLLGQNRKTGMKNLRQMLDEEVADAFEERKNLARRQGEEAGTKLLLPLFMMLGIVMVIVVVPAFLSFY